MGKLPVILLATTNQGKLAEVRSLLADLPVQLVSLDEFPSMAEPVEDAATFIENAEIKARHYAGLAGCWSLADDSGLEVDALQGRPGVYSARFAGLACDDKANNAKLVQELVATPPDRCTARFRCAVVLAGEDRILATAEGAFEGMIVAEPRGANGFGYDPHFLIPSLGKTAAELTREEKNRISHRGQALRVLREEMETLLANGPEL